MSSLIEQLDRKTLNRLDLPKSFESQQGLERLFLQKVLNLAYLVNDIWNIPHKLDIRGGTAITNAGASFTAPINARRIVFFGKWTFTASATVGSRSVIVVRRDKANSDVPRWFNRTVTAGVAENYNLGPESATDATVNVLLNYPVCLEPEWQILADDSSNIDANDTLAWNIEYVEVPI